VHRSNFALGEVLVGFGYYSFHVFGQLHWAGQVAFLKGFTAFFLLGGAARGRPNPNSCSYSTRRSTEEMGRQDPTDCPGALHRRDNKIKSKFTSYRNHLMMYPPYFLHSMQVRRRRRSFLSCCAVKYQVIYF
jgi:hypothetical protein